MRFSIVAVLWLLIGAAIFVNSRYVERSLLRADPDALPANATLFGFGASRGAPLFVAHCAVCHGVSGLGDPNKGIPTLSDNDWLYGTGRVADIEQVIEYGIRARNSKGWNLAIMPAYARLQPNPADQSIQSLSPDEISDLIEFLFTLQGKKADAARASRGAALYAGRAGCYDCHSPDAKGDTAIGAPNLTDGITLYGESSRDALLLSIAYGRQGVCPAWVKQLSPAAIRELALYVYSISHPGVIQNANH
ncbi:MAG TPA: c-type cytochrome [Steroidobacteraceae bacterium]